jgi:hypothetical protein
MFDQKEEKVSKVGSKTLSSKEVTLLSHPHVITML